MSLMSVVEPNSEACMNLTMNFLEGVGITMPPPPDPDALPYVQKLFAER